MSASRPRVRPHAILIALLLIVGISVVGSLVAILHEGKEAQLARTRMDFQALDSAVRLFALAKGRPPTTAQGLAALAEVPMQPAGEPLFHEVPRDIWNEPYGYECSEAEAGAWRWHFRSAGPDRMMGSTDDIRSEVGSLAREGDG